MPEDHFLPAAHHHPDGRPASLRHGRFVNCERVVFADLTGHDRPRADQRLQRPGRYRSVRFSRDPAFLPLVAALFLQQDPRSCLFSQPSSAPSGASFGLTAREWRRNLIGPLPAGARGATGRVVKHFPRRALYDVGRPVPGVTSCGRCAADLGDHHCGRDVLLRVPSSGQPAASLSARQPHGPRRGGIQQHAVHTRIPAAADIQLPSCPSSIQFMPIRPRPQTGTTWISAARGRGSLRRCRSRESERTGDFPMNGPVSRHGPSRSCPATEPAN